MCGVWWGVVDLHWFPKMFFKAKKIRKQIKKNRNMFLFAIVCVVLLFFTLFCTFMICVLLLFALFYYLLHISALCFCTFCSFLLVFVLVCSVLLFLHFLLALFYSFLLFVCSFLLFFPLFVFVWLCGVNTCRNMLHILFLQGERTGRLHVSCSICGVS